MRQKCWCLAPKGFNAAVSGINFEHEAHFEHFTRAERSCLTENGSDVTKLRTENLENERNILKVISTIFLERLVFGILDS